MISIIQIFLFLTNLSLSWQAGKLLRSDPFSCNEITPSLKSHNEKRNDVALGKTKLSGAKNMWQLKWDTELADIAHNYAKKCEFEHNQNRPKDTGENIAWRASHSDSQELKADIVSMIMQWYDEIYNYDEDGNSNGTVGHFTQMVWAKTKFLGCGLAYYEDQQNYPETPYCSILVCNYRPAGNFIGENMYVKHDGEDKCDDGVASQEFKGLCAHDAMHAKTGDVCSEGRILEDSIIAMLINFAIAWYYLLRD